MGTAFRPLRSFSVVGTDTKRSTTCNCLLAIKEQQYYGTMGLFRIDSEINGDLGRKSWYFPPHVFNAPLRGLPLEFCLRKLRLKKLEWCPYLPIQKVLRYVPSFRYNDRRTAEIVKLALCMLTRDKKIEKKQTLWCKENVKDVHLWRFEEVYLKIDATGSFAHWHAGGQVVHEQCAPTVQVRLAKQLTDSS